MKKSKLAIAALFATLFVSQHNAFANDAIESSAMEVAGITSADAFDLNTVTVEQLMTLPGIGRSKAQAIIDYRTDKGYFHEVEQLTEVRGIGNKLLAKMRERLKVVQH